MPRRPYGSDGGHPENIVAVEKNMPSVYMEDMSNSATRVKKNDNIKKVSKLMSGGGCGCVGDKQMGGSMASDAVVGLVDESGWMTMNANQTNRVNSHFQWGGASAATKAKFVKGVLSALEHPVYKGGASIDEILTKNLAGDAKKKYVKFVKGLQKSNLNQAGGSTADLMGNVESLSSLLSPNLKTSAGMFRNKLMSGGYGGFANIANLALDQLTLEGAQKLGDMLNDKSILKSGVPIKQIIVQSLMTVPSTKCKDLLNEVKEQYGGSALKLVDGISSQNLDKVAALVGVKSSGTKALDDLKLYVGSFFEQARYQGAGLADAQQSDLTIFTSLPSQRILFGCGSNTLSTLILAQDQVSFNSSVYVQSITLSNLNATAISVPTIANIQTLSNANGPLQAYAMGSISLTIDQCQSTPAASISVAGSVSPAIAVSPNSFVGIGTAVPGSTLDVQGSVGVSGVQILDCNRNLSVTSATVAGQASFAAGQVTMNPNTRITSVAALDVTGTCTLEQNVTCMGSASISGPLTVNNASVLTGSNLGIGTQSPRSSIDTVGSFIGLAGTVSPCFSFVPSVGYTDIQSGGYFALDGSLEPGNPGNPVLSNLKPLMTGGTMLGTDGSGEGAMWGRVRFVIRGVLMGSQISNPSSTMAIHRLPVLYYTMDYITD
ncbi:hypothetical protein CEUSTIGMA_g12572.t1 [Chlamydomonas eustigma]|uniref:Uncharacterized protein n=1 Tax=Chlamydomonas eustigma TaxID=1157962 RepID=A0A250XPZ3_9CHLO|nr:hypothetical protein CEUSTIGMA_g12572.t1 [Chlamydomonas eustigma]|eukprot:GAX85154.1 hypothetical protein CEUSTIGMA_g12572.t1 [Chlamydomonas eustigma]